MVTCTLKNILPVLFSAVFLEHAFPNPQDHPISSSTQPGLEAISASSLQKHMAVLGSDSLEGRGTGTRGGERAAQYIAEELAKLKLVPIGDDSSYYQSIPMHGSRVLPNSTFIMTFQGKEHEFVLHRDYVLYNSGAPTFVPKPAPMVFVGYGIIAPEFDYNDYQSLDVSGKIVVFLSGEPPSSDSSYFDGSRPTLHYYPEVKQRVAISRGAAGSVVIPNPREAAGRNWRHWLMQFAFEDVTLLYSVTANLSALINPQAAQELFRGAPYTLSQILDMDAANNMRSFPLAVAAAFRGQFQERDFLAPNVIAMLEGDDPRLKDSYLLISAHYDHLGIGPAAQGDSIYNGVFDNAAGVAAVLEIARAFTLMPERPRRSVIFLFTTAEEKGLLGATYYTDHRVMPLYKTIANVNVDGLAMFDTFNDVVGVGAELSTLGGDLQKILAAFKMRASPIPSPFLNSAAFTRSDQIAFAKAGIPAVLLMEGVDYRHSSPAAGLQRMIEWGQRIYHSPFDDLRQPINFAAARQHGQILFSFCWSLANGEEAPQWKPGTPYVNARLRSIAEKR